jgi:pre-mRNA-splicing factor ATP-dependent RNA helicase DHX38/PRP16
MLTYVCALLLVLHAQAAAGLGDADDDDEAGGRKGSQFRSHMKKSEAASEFSRTKTIAQQRRSLPVYTVRDELLQVRACWGR